MGIRVHRTVAQTVVGLGVLVLLAGGVWLAGSPSGEVAECFRTRPCSSMPTCPVEIVPEAPPPPAHAYSLGALVPATARFVVSTSWAKLRLSPWFESGILNDRLLLNPWGLLPDEPADVLWDPLKLLEPELGPHTVDEDILAGEIVLAGNITGRADPAGGRPGISLSLVLARISPRYAEALSTLTVKKAKERLHPDVELTMLDGGIVRVHSTRREFTSMYGHRRGGIQELRHVPSLPLYVYRSRDVVAFSLQEAVMREVANTTRVLEEQPGLARFMEDVPKTPPGGLSAWLDLEPLHNYMNRAMVHFGAPLCLLRRWFAVTTLEDLKLSCDASDPDWLRASGELTFEPGRLTPLVRAAYLEEPLSLEAGASTVPTKDTFAFLTVRCPAEWVLKSVFEDLIRPVDHEQQTERQRTGPWREALVDSLGDTWALALARRSDVDDAIHYDGITAPQTSSVPGTLTWAVIVDLAEDASAADVSMLVERLSARLYGNPTEPVAYRGHTLHVGSIPSDDSWWAPTAWLVTDEVVVMSNWPPYLERLVDTRLDREGSLARDATWQETFAELPGDAHVGGFVDLGKLFSVPTTPGPSGQPRGLLWDRRLARVQEQHNYTEELLRINWKMMREAGVELGALPNDEVLARIQVRVGEYMTEWRARYPEFEERYRKSLLRHSQLRGLGFTIVVDGATMHLRGVLGAENDDR